MMKEVAVALLLLCLLVTPEIIEISGQSRDLAVTVEPREPCIAGFPCEINVTITNLDGPIMLDYVKLITPWGATVKNLGLRGLAANSTTVITVIVEVDRSSLEGANFIRPLVRFFKKGEIGLKTIEGNRSSILIIKPKVNATLYVVLNKEEIYVGEPLLLEGSYKIEGIPKNFRPSLSLYLDGHLCIERELNGTVGGFSFTIPVRGEGTHTLIASLCYGIGCVDESFNVTVKKMVRVVSGFSKEDLIKLLAEVKGLIVDLQGIYERAVADSIPLPEDTLVNMSIIDSKVREAESISKEENISYSDILRARSLINQSKILIEELVRALLNAYKTAMKKKILEVEKELDDIKELNKTEYNSIRERLKELSSNTDAIDTSNASEVYSNVTAELTHLKERIASIREKATEEAKLLSAITTSLIFVAMISGATIILRKWKSQLAKEE